MSEALLKANNAFISEANSRFIGFNDCLLIGKWMFLCPNITVLFEMLIWENDEFNV